MDDETWITDLEDGDVFMVEAGPHIDNVHPNRWLVMRELTRLYSDDECLTFAYELADDRGNIHIARLHDSSLDVKIPIAEA